MTDEKKSFYGELLPYVARQAYENGEKQTIERILKIIDEKHDDFKDGSFRDNSITYAQAWKRSNEAIKAGVLALQGGKKT